MVVEIQPSILANAPMRKSIEEQSRACQYDRNDSQPHKYERAFTFSRGRGGDAENQGETPKYIGQELNHRSSTCPPLGSPLRLRQP